MKSEPHKGRPSRCAEGNAGACHLTQHEAAQVPTEGVRCDEGADLLVQLELCVGSGEADDGLQGTGSHWQGASRLRLHPTQEQNKISLKTAHPAMKT